MKKILFVLLLICSTLLYDTVVVQAQNAPCSDCGNVVISSIVNGRTSGRRGIQICAINDVPDLSNYHLATEDSNLSDSEFVGYNRDGSAHGSITGFSGSLLAGECIWLVDNFFNITDPNNFLDFMEGTVDISEVVDGTFNVDDDKNVLLLCKGNIDDIYGTYIAALDEDDDFMTNATDEIAEDDPAFYGDTWVLSNNDRCPNGGTMDIANWTVGPIDDLDEFPDPDGGPFGEVVDFISQSSFPGANYTNSNSGSCSNVRTCGGIEFCTEVRYECVEDPDGLDDHLMKIDYIGMEPGLELILLELYDCNITFDASSDDPTTTPNGTIVLLNVENQSGCGTSSTLWGIEFISPGCDGVQFWDRVPEDCILECSNGVMDGDETGVDCGGSCPNVCVTVVDPTCDDGMMNGDETGVDCGGATCPECVAATCDDGMMNGDETGVDCGGATCPECVAATCDDGIMNGDETGVDCGGATCEACDTTTDPTCTDGIMNGDEEGVDCGGATCPACEMMATCTDGIMNGDETGIDCGGATCEECAPNPAAIPTMSQWGLILLTLLTLTFVTVSVTAGQLSMAGSKGSSSHNMSSFSSYPFVKSVFVKAMMFTALCALVAAIGTLAVYGSITTTDFVGTMIAGPVFAYLLHLLILINKK